MGIHKHAQIMLFLSYPVTYKFKNQTLPESVFGSKH